jgi:hypothetical protein
MLVTDVDFTGYRGMHLRVELVHTQDASCVSCKSRAFRLGGYRAGKLQGR